MRLALWFFVLAASAAQPPAAVERLNAIAPRMQALVEAHEIPGCVYYVAQHGQVLAHLAVGRQDIESRRPWRRSTR